MTAPENIRERVAEALLCQCGHDIGGEHNTNGCYATVDYGQRTQRRCDCPRTDDQDPLGALLSLIDTLLREQREGIAAAIMEAAPRLNFELRPDGTSEPAAAAYVEGFRDAWSAARTFGGDR